MPRPAPDVADGTSAARVAATVPVADHRRALDDGSRRSRTVGVGSGPPGERLERRSHRQAVVAGVDARAVWQAQAARINRDS